MDVMYISGTTLELSILHQYNKYVCTVPSVYSIRVLDIVYFFVQDKLRILFVHIYKLLADRTLHHHNKSKLFYYLLLLELNDLYSLKFIGVSRGSYLW